MTLPFERARAVRQTEKFLLELCDPKKTPRIPKQYRDQAKALLMHYPTLHDLYLIENYWTQSNAWIQCPFATKDSMFGDLT